MTEQRKGPNRDYIIIVIIIIIIIVIIIMWAEIS